MPEPLIAERHHPAGRRLTNLERALIRLRLVGHEIDVLIESAIRTEDRKADYQLVVSMTNYGVILVVKFLEVWDQFIRLGGEEPRVRQAGSALSPAIRRIDRTWPHIRRYRHWALAHPYSIGDGPEVVLPWELLAKEVAPSAEAEVFLLLECARMAVVGVLVCFASEYRAMLPVFAVIDTPSPTRGCLTGEDTEKERRSLCQILNERLSEVGVDLADPIFKEFGTAARRRAAGQEG